MTYQIPQQLEYKEKIMFGLTFTQLAYAMLFIGIDLILFKRISNFYVLVFMVLIVSTLGIGFIFLNFSTWIKNYWIFLKFQKVLKGDSKLKQLIGINSIENNLIITSKNKKVAILKVQPINFSIKQQTEKDSIIYSFQKFLNSLDFPTQIIMNTESINLDDYLKSLESKLEDKKFKDLFAKYKTYIHDIITNNKLMNRVFYVIIPEQSNIDIQVEICIERLASLNLKVTRLESYALKGLLLNCFSGKGVGKDLLQWISPNLIINKQDYFQINEGEFRRIVYAHGYPRNVEAGFLDKIVSALADFNLSLHIKPYPIERMIIDLNRELQKQRADLYGMGLKGIINPSLEIQYADTRSTLENLQKGKERLFNIGLYISCKASSLEELNLLTKKVESELNSLMILPKIARLRMIQGFKSTLPLGVDELNANRNITTDALSAFFPFTSQFLQADNTGVWLGMNNNGIPIIKDIFKLPNPNGLVLAQSGGGKSYFCKLLITRYLLNGTRVMIIDPQSEYKNLVDYFGGERITISKDSDNIINPLDLMGHDFTEKRLSLIDLMKIMLGDLSESQLSWIDRAIGEAYARKGITNEESTWQNEPPILEDLLKILEVYEKKANQNEKSTLRSLINRLTMYVTGVFSFMNKHTKIAFGNKLVCFDVGNMPKQVKPAVMFLVLDYVYMKMKSDLSRKILLIDESWSLLGRSEDASYIFEIVKTCRKFNLGLLLINQEVEGLFATQAGKSVLANSAYTLLMRQKPAVIKDICNTFHLSENERQHILTCGIGEGLLIMEDDHSKIKVVSSPEEHKIITTNPDEINEREKAKKESERANAQPKTKVKINLDDSKGCFLLKKLNEEEIKYLTSKGYKISEHKSFLSKKPQMYMLRPRFNESAGHCFVIHDIKNYLEKRNIKVETPTTKKPDVIFERNGKTFAIEVETGACISNMKKFREKLEVLKGYKNWFFVVTNKKPASKYRKFGKTLEPRYMLNSLNKILGK
jgi:type IV secretory pathway VirB4 component